MFLKRIFIYDFKILKNVELTFDSDFQRRVFPLGSQNGGGKSTLLQLIFTLLHCSFDQQKIYFIANLLEDYKLKENQPYKNLADFEIFHKNQNVELEFFLVNKSFYSDFENNILSDVIFNLNKEIIQYENIIEKYDLNIKELNDFFEYLEKIDNFDKEDKKQEIRQKLLNLNLNKGEIDVLGKDLNLLKQMLLDQIEISEFHKNTSIESIKEINYKLKISEFLITKEDYKKISTNKITNFSNIDFEIFYSVKNLETKKIDNFTKELSEKIFLASPITQIFHFESKKTKSYFFKMNESDKMPKLYYDSINESKSKLTNFYTYDHVVTEQLKQLLFRLRNDDTKILIETGSYGNNFSEFLKELNKVFSNKIFIPTEDLQEIKIKVTDVDAVLKFADLSHGELKYLSIYLWLRINKITDGIILMDEIENNFHPDWQLQIVKDLMEWTPENQFVLATHSYELCYAVTPAHVKEIEPKLFNN